MSLTELVDELALIVEASQPGEYRDGLHSLPPSR
jgi:hypothetical protein